MNISSIHDCYGCGVCAIVCSRNIISIESNSDGFYEPRITDSQKCTDCGLCVSVCAYSHDKLSLEFPEIHSYASWSNDFAVRRKCSSGGIGFELGRTLIHKGYKVCGVRYNAAVNRAEHYIAATVEELIQSIGSKYIQSYTVDGLKAINRKEKYLVTGSPCQIDSFRHYIKKFKIEDNFVLMDFFCHGVPSKLMWDKYLVNVERTTGKVVFASWRNKLTGWHDSYAMAIDGEEKGEKVNRQGSYNELMKERNSFIYSRLSQGDIFYKLFLSDACLGKACYEKCKYKYDRSSADIRIGDLWGKTYQDNEEGVSAAIAFTEKGDKMLKLCNCTLVEHPFDVVAEGQMKTAPLMTSLHGKIGKLLRHEDISIEDVYRILTSSARKIKNIDRLKHPLRSIVNLFRKIK